jgi:hydrogenase-4 component F
MSRLAFDALSAVLVIPLNAAALLALLPGYRLTARLNMLASLLTFLAALSLLVADWPRPGRYLLVDDLSIVFVVLSTLVGFSTSVFSASYIGHELATGRLTPTYLRFYHAMYQVLMFAMNLALVANNIGLMWVAIELATLTTVLMVGIYRTHEALEAAWKYFILGSVGIGLALFGTILVYMAAQPVVGEGLDAMTWTVLLARVAAFDAALLMSPSFSCCSATAPRLASRRCTLGCRMRTRRARRRSRRCFPGFCSTSRFTPCCVSRCCWRQTRGRSRPDR